VFSIDSNVVVSEKNFTRLLMRSEGFTVEEVPYAEISNKKDYYVVPHYL
jgi:tRNA(Glu) U13 pseudouridine synthase TruD